MTRNQLLLLLVALMEVVSRRAPVAAHLPRRVKCTTMASRHRCFDSFVCPLDCPRTCFVDCKLCKPVCSCNYPGAVCQDPRFVGGDGIAFYFHGHKDQNFCLVSDSNLHINAHFIGKRNPKLKRDFTWVQSLGLIFDNHKLLIAAQKTSSWDDNADHLYISLDDKPVSLPTKAGSKWHSSEIIISRTSNYNGLLIEVPNNFRVLANAVPITKKDSKIHGYRIGDDNCFAHL